MCQSCEALTINGVLCHEQGCPDSWRDEVRECAWCGCDFQPEEKYQECCSDSCYNIYIGGEEETIDRSSGIHYIISTFK